MNRLFEPMFGHQIKSECDIFLKTHISYYVWTLAFFSYRPINIWVILISPN